jgi:hypothetical protein
MEAIDICIEQILLEYHIIFFLFNSKWRFQVMLSDNIQFVTMPSVRLINLSYLIGCALVIHFANS